MHGCQCLSSEEDAKAELEMRQKQRAQSINETESEKHSISIGDLKISMLASTSDNEALSSWASGPSPITYPPISEKTHIKRINKTKE